MGAKTGYVTPLYIDSTQAQASATGVTVTAPTGIAANDFLFATAYSTSSGLTWSPPSGWLLVDSINTTHSIALFKKIATGSEPGSYTFGTGSSSPKWATVFDYRGASTVSTNNLAGVSVGSADPQVAASMSVTINRILLAVMGVNSGSTTLTSGPAGMTSREQQFSSPSPRGAVFDLVNAATGASGTKSFDISSSTAGAAFLVELQ